MASPFLTEVRQHQAPPQPGGYQVHQVSSQHQGLELRDVRIPGQQSSRLCKIPETARELYEVEPSEQELDQYQQSDGVQRANQKLLCIENELLRLQGLETFEAAGAGHSLINKQPEMMDVIKQ